MSTKKTYIAIAGVMALNVLVVGLAWQYGSSRIKQSEAGSAEGLILTYGEQASEYSGTDMRGRPVKIEKGVAQVTLLVFFNPTIVHETLIYLNALNERYGDRGLKTVGVSSGSVEQTQQFISQHRLGYPIIHDPRGDVHRVFKFHPHHAHGGILLLNRDLTVKFSNAQIILPDFLRQLVESHLLGQIDYSYFQPSLDAFRVGDSLPPLRAVRVGSRKIILFGELAKPDAVFVFFTAQCASCRLPDYINRLKALQERLSGQSTLYGVFSATFPHQELEYYKRTKFPQTELYICLDEIQGLENKYATRYSSDWGPVVVRTGSDGRIISVDKLLEMESISLVASRTKGSSKE